MLILVKKDIVSTAPAFKAGEQDFEIIDEEQEVDSIPVQEINFPDLDSKNSTNPSSVICVNDNDSQ